MSKKSLAGIAPAILASSLLLNIVFVSCSADAVTTPVIPQTQDAATLAALVTIVERLDSIDARTERIDQATTQAIDTILSALSDPDGTFLMGIADAVSLGVGVGTSVCAELGGTLGGEWKIKAKGEGLVRGSIGPSALEAEAMAEAKGRLIAEGEYKLGLEGAVKATVCVSADLGLDLIAVGAEMRSQLESMGVTGPAISSMVSQVRAPTTLNYRNTLSAVEAALPVPSGLRTVFSDPTALLRDSPALSQFALGSQCGGTSFFPSGAFADMVTRLCALNIPSAEDYIGILNGLSGLPATVNSLGTDLSSVCGTVNTIRNRDGFSIPSRSVTILGTSYTTFPGFSRSFANVGAAC